MWRAATYAASITGTPAEGGLDEPPEPDSGKAGRAGCGDVLAESLLTIW
jgi:hypothetical protein